MRSLATAAKSLLLCSAGAFSLSPQALRKEVFKCRLLHEPKAVLASGSLGYSIDLATLRHSSSATSRRLSLSYVKARILLHAIASKAGDLEPAAKLLLKD